MRLNDSRSKKYFAIFLENPGISLQRYKNVQRCYITKEIHVKSTIHSSCKKKDVNYKWKKQQGHTVIETIVLVSLQEFLKKLPKIELHAHLNGSLSNASIQELGMAVYGANTEEFIKVAEASQNFGETVDLNKCFEKFQIIQQMTRTRKGLELATTLAIRDFAIDNVIYLELRTTPKSNEHMTQHQYLECVLNAILAAQKLYPTIMVKLIPSIDRSKPVKVAEETLNVVLELKQKYPGLMVGVDLSGNPFHGAFNDFVPLLRRARDNGLKLALHCAESNNMHEIQEMVDFGMQRCGHGTFLNESQIAKLVDQNTIIECCLSSNVKCKTAASYAEHHFGRIFPSYASSVVLCTDDSGIFDTNLSNELLIASQAFSLSKDQLLQLSINAVDNSFACANELKEIKSNILNYFAENALIQT